MSRCSSFFLSFFYFFSLYQVGVFESLTISRVLIINMSVVTGFCINLIHIFNCLKERQMILFWVLYNTSLHKVLHMKAPSGLKSTL